MKKKLIILILSLLLLCSLSSRNLIQQIENVYDTLDSVAYVENTILSYRSNWVIRYKGYEESADLLNVINNLDSIQRQKKTIDSLWENLTLRSKTLIEERVSRFVSTLNNSGEPIYVLNLTVGRSECSDKPFFLHPNTTCLPFNLFYLDERLNLKFYVLVENGRYVDSGNVWFTFSRPVARNFPRVLRSIMRKNPQYLLLSAELEGTNTLLYMLDNRIYVYRIAQRKKYELSEYLRKYPPQFIRSE